MKRILALFLCVLLLGTLFSGCGALSVGGNQERQEPEALRAAIEKEFGRHPLIKCEMQNDEAGAFELFHPDSVTEEGFHQTFAFSQEYFPIQEGYTLTTQSWDTYQSTSNQDHDTHRGEYLVETDGQQFHLFVALVSNDKGKGFKQWNLLNEEDDQTYLESQKKN